MKRAIVIGCGICGSVVARQLAEAGWQIDIYERRNHIAGNMYDYVDDHGILVHKYGPHIFHTDSQIIFDYINKFSSWDDYQLECGAEIDGICTPTPFNFETIDQFYSTQEADSLKAAIKDEFKDRKTITVLEAMSAKSPLIRSFANFLFEKDYSLYTAKQWGLKPSDIDPSILKRVPLKLNYEKCYFDDKYQALPSDSYTKFFENLLNHRNIQVHLNVDAIEHLSISGAGSVMKWDSDEVLCPVIFTGAIDELFDHCFGALPYRSLKFVWKYEDRDSIQSKAVVAYPQEDGFTRIVEFKKLPNQTVEGTTYEIEYPIQYEPGQQVEPYYPVLTESSKILFKKYADKADKIKNFYRCGRLAEFQYYNMDQALDRALQCAASILNNY